MAFIENLFRRSPVDFSVESIGNYQMDHIPFAQYSVDTDLSPSRDHPKKLHLCGGFGDTESQICELNAQTTRVSSLQALYRKQHSSLQEMACRNGFNILSFVTRDNKNIICMQPWNGRYNVYNTDRDTWLLPAKNTIKLFKMKKIGQRALFLCDRVLMLSYENEVCFFDLKNLQSPVLMERYAIKSQLQSQCSQGYLRHGMCVLDLKFLPGEKLKKSSVGDDCNDCCKESVRLYVSFVLFGGIGNIPFSGSMIEFGVTLAWVENEICRVESVCENNIARMNMNVGRNLLQCYNFSCHCVWNTKKEPIIVMLGGFADDVYETGDSVFLYNFKTNTLNEMRKVLPLNCSKYPATSVEGTKCHIVQDKSYCCLSLTRLLPKYGGHTLDIKPQFIPKPDLGIKDTNSSMISVGSNVSASSSSVPINDLDGSDFKSEKVGNFAKKVNENKNSEYDIILCYFRMIAKLDDKIISEFDNFSDAKEWDGERKTLFMNTLIDWYDADTQKNVSLHQILLFLHDVKIIDMKDAMDICSVNEKFEEMKQEHFNTLNDLNRHEFNADEYTKYLESEMKFDDLEPEPKSTGSVLKQIAKHESILNALRRKQQELNNALSSCICQQEGKINGLKAENKAMIDEFESGWRNWSVQDVVAWFKYVVSTHETTFEFEQNKNEVDTDAESGTDSESVSEDEERIGMHSDGDKCVNFYKIEKILDKKRFRAKYMLEKVNRNKLKTYGFENKIHYGLLSRAIKDLTRKHRKKPQIEGQIAVTGQ